MIKQPPESLPPPPNPPPASIELEISALDANLRIYSMHVVSIVCFRWILIVLLPRCCIVDDVTENPLLAILYCSMLFPNPYRSTYCICLLFLKSPECAFYNFYYYFIIITSFVMISTFFLCFSYHCFILSSMFFLLCWWFGWKVTENVKRIKISLKTKFVYLWFVYYIFFTNETWKLRTYSNVSWNSLPHENKLWNVCRKISKHIFTHQIEANFLYMHSVINI